MATDHDPPWNLDEQLEQLASIIAEQLDTGASRATVVSYLGDLEVEEEFAAAFANEVVVARASQRRRSGLGAVVFGIVLIGAGVGITALTYSIAGPGGTYLVTWGLVIWGVVKAGQGLLLFAKKTM